MDLDLTVAQRIIRNTVTESDNQKSEPIVSDLNQSGDRKRYCSKEVAAAKGCASEAGIHTCSDAMRILGGFDTIQEYPVERLYREVRLTTSSFGTGKIQRSIIACELMQ